MDQPISYTVSRDNQPLNQDPQYWEKNIENPAKKTDIKKAIFLAILAGPKASLVVGSVMLKKMLANFGIILTKEMMAMFAFNLMVTAGLWYIYKKENPEV